MNELQDVIDTFDDGYPGIGGWWCMKRRRR